MRSTCRWLQLSHISIFLHALGLFFPIHTSSVQSPEVSVLMEVKKGVEDPGGFLQTWAADTQTPCQWTGVSCDPSSHAVTAIDLSNMNLSGLVPAQVCELPNLLSYNLGNNFLYGEFPQKLLDCRRLEYLNLSQNLIVGLLPTAIANLQNLQDLDLSFNNFTGSIPPGFGDLPLLQTLNLTANLLNATIPGFLGNLSNLRWLDMAYNPFMPGRIPYELGNLHRLLNLHLAVANLVWTIPDSLGNLTELTYFLDLSQNDLEGMIPPGIMSLPKLQKMELYGNNLSGQIPLEMAKLVSITDIDLSENSLSGFIPPDVRKLQNLELLNLWGNKLEGEIPPGIGDLPKLSRLQLFSNNLTGYLPQNLGQGAPFISLDVSDNRLTGPLPPHLCTDGQLQDLLVFSNSFWGEIPQTYGNCSSLLRVRMNGNNLSGEIPQGFWNAPQLSYLDLSDNSLSGLIHPSIAAAVSLTTLLLSNNTFTGSLPLEIAELSLLIKLTADRNQFSGSIPPHFGNLSNLDVLSISQNHLSGEIPPQISGCLRLSQLDLSRNSLDGPIPASLGSLTHLTDLDLSHNQLRGAIPMELQTLHFFFLNLSFNNLSGTVPAGLINGAFATSFIGNSHLCGEALQSLSPCPSHHPPHTSNPFLWAVATPSAAAATILLTGSIVFYQRYRSRSRNQNPKRLWSLTSFHRLGFSEYEILGCLEEEKVIGRGSAGKVYKATLSNGQEVAVKKLFTSSRSIHPKGSDYGFGTEVETLGRLRHKNIVKLLCCCSNGDAKLLVYEYMAKGSLGDQLHGGGNGSFLDWPTRLRIALGAAEGLAYLHHGYTPPILHCDVKSNNILLDAEYEARVADFGLAKILLACGKDVSVSTIAGTHGYIAPEFAYTSKVNEKSDVYSFGVVLMELLTGKRPIEREFGDGVDIVKWIHTKLRNRGVGMEQVLDPRLESSCQGQMIEVLKISILCTSDLPLARPSMREVVQMLQEADPKQRERILGSRLSKSTKTF